MTLGVSKLLTAVDGSVGRDKSNLRPVPNLANHIPAEEWNNVKNMIAELTAVVGRATGEDADSIARELRGMTSGALSARWRISEDFLAWAFGSKTFLTGAGAATLRRAVSASEGAGILELAHTGLAGTAQYLHDDTNDTIDGGCEPQSRFRFKTPTSLVASDFRIGMRETIGGSWMEFGWDHTTTGRVYTRSDAGSGTLVSDVTTLVPSTWYEVELRPSTATGKVAVYINGAFVMNAGDATSTIRAGDVLSPFHALLTRVGASATVLVDWFVTEGARL